MLEIRGLRAGYGSVEILRGIDLDVGQGEIVAVLGSNGVGKSTLNNNISALYRPFSGSIRFKGEELVGRSSTDIVKRGVIHVPEGRRIFPNLNVLENLELGSLVRGTARRKQNIEHVVSIFPRLKERFTQLAGTLSGGEQQMVAIGRGLMSEPELLIMDEPSLGLSPLLVEEMFALIQKINREGQSILLMEQNAVQTLAIANRAYIIENGHVAMQGKAADLIHDPDLRKNYLGL
ncbi:ABC transporter ATP-binding protein [Hydrogenophaga defluvii]|uniref:ABC transporter ATP-binding protein n=1 Tax=Hydrogenophaga defluvii TaxID=249410 RepID=A0ABW2SCQ0_9BURK